MSKTRLPKDLQKALADLHQAEEMAEDVAQSNGDESIIPTTKSIESIKKQMQKPAWRIKTKNRLSGGLKQQVFTLEIEAEFGLDTDTLLDTIDKHNHLRKSDVQAYKQAAIGLDPEINDIVLDSLLPKAFGLSSNVSLLEKQSMVDDLPVENFTKTQWPLTMTVVEDLVHFDYVDMLNYLLGGIRLINKKNFGEEVWVHAEFFRGKNSFSRSFYWDNSDVIVSIEAEFERIS